MKLHFVSKSYAVPMAFQAQELGCKVTVHMNGATCGGGMFPKVPTPDAPHNVDAVIVDGLGWGQIADDMARDGKRVLFGGKWADVVVTNCDFMRSVLSKAGLPMASADAPPAPPYTIVVGGWYESEFRDPYFIGVVHDRLLERDLGAPCGPVSAQVEPADTQHPLVGEFLTPLAKVLTGTGYRGIISVALRPDGHGGAYADGLLVGVQPQIIEAVSEMVFGGFPALVSTDGARHGGDCACSIALSMPYWPASVPKPEHPVALKLASGQRKRFWPLDVKKQGDELIYTAEIGVLGSVTARGRMPRPGQVEEGWCVGHRHSTWRAYQTIGRLGIPYVQYRLGLGNDTSRLIETVCGMTATKGQPA